MRQFSRFIICAFLWLGAIGSASAQTVQPVVQQSLPVRFGYLSYNAIFQTMPDYKVAQQKLAELKAKYDQEARRGEEEFQRLFAEFLQGRKDFPENILKKRQYELQDLLERNIRFKEEARQLLEQAEKDLQADMVYLLNEAIRAVGMENGYACIVNTDGYTCPFINPAMADDVTNLVKEKLQLPLNVEPEP